MLVAEFPECPLRQRLGRHVRRKWGAVVALLLEVLNRLCIPIILVIQPRLYSQFHHRRSG